MDGWREVEILVWLGKQKVGTDSTATERATPPEPRGPLEPHRVTEKSCWSRFPPDRWRDRWIDREVERERER